MIDLTAITTPYGLLDPETQKSLREHGGPWQTWGARSGWGTIEEPNWCDGVVYRVKPEPPKPREWYAVVSWGGEIVVGSWRDREAAEWQANSFPSDATVIHVREVVE